MKYIYKNYNNNKKLHLLLESTLFIYFMKKLVLMGLLIAQSSLQAQYSSSRLSIGASGQLNAGNIKNYTSAQLGYGAALRVDWRIVKNLHLLTSVGVQHLRQKWNGLFFGNQVDPQTGVIITNSYITNTLYLPIELAYTFPLGNSLAVYPTIGANLKSEMRDKEWGGAILFGVGINKNLNNNGSLFTEIKVGGDATDYRIGSLSVGYVYKIK